MLSTTPAGALRKSFPVISSNTKSLHRSGFVNRSDCASQRRIPISTGCFDSINGGRHIPWYLPLRRRILTQRHSKSCQRVRRPGLNMVSNCVNETDPKPALDVAPDRFRQSFISLQICHMTCPKCSSNQVYRSRSTDSSFLRFILSARVRCYKCSLTFLVRAWRARNRPRNMSGLRRILCDHHRPHTRTLNVPD
jgi:hypothetical protein